MLRGAVANLDPPRRSDDWNFIYRLSFRTPGSLHVHIHGLSHLQVVAGQWRMTLRNERNTGRGDAFPRRTEKVTNERLGLKNHRADIYIRASEQRNEMACE